MHGGRARERIVADAEGRCEIDLAVDGLAHRDGAEHTREPGHVTARDGDAMELPVETERVLRQARRNERTADAARVVGGRGLADVDPELGEHAADAPRLGIVGLLERTERRHLALLDAIERCLQADDRATHAARVLDGKTGAGIDRRCPIRRQQEGPLVIDRRGFERSWPRLGGGAAARGLLDRAGDVAEAIQRARTRFQRRLPAQDLVELLLELLLVEQLPA